MDDEEKLNPWDQQPKEGIKSHEAFKIYLKLGVDRRLGVVAKELGKSVQHMRGWSSKYKWKDRIRQYETHIYNIETQERNKIIFKMENRHIANSKRVEQILMQPVNIVHDAMADDPAFREKMLIHITQVMQPNDIIYMLQNIPKGLTNLAKLERLSLGVETEHNKNDVTSKVHQTINFATTEELESIMKDEKGKKALQYLADFTSDIRNSKHFEDIPDFETMVTGGSA